MGIEQNFNKNLKKAVKKQTHTLPSDSKFLLHQLVKNIDEVENMLERRQAEYNVGELREVIDEFQTEEEELEEYKVPGSWTNYSGYGKVKPAFTFKSQGPNPGSMVGSGYNFQSKGPLGVSYFTESKKYNVGDLKKVIRSLREDIVDIDPDKEPCEGQPCFMNCTNVGTGDCYCDSSKPEGERKCIPIKSGKVDVEDNKDVKGGLQNRGRGERALDSLRHESVLKDLIKRTVKENISSEKKLLNEGKPCCTKYCWFSPKLGDACDGGDGHKGGRWSNTVNGCSCSYDKTADGWDVGGKYVAKGKDKYLSSDDVEVEMDEATGAASAGAYETPRFWAKDKKNQRFAKERWMPGAQYVKVKEKCKKFPYCNQGDINALEIWEKQMMRESAKNVAKKTGLSEKEVREKIEREIEEIIRRSFYKSPVTDLVGGGKMNTPIGKIFTMSGNKPKYES
jgi:hypothetical protein